MNEENIIKKLNLNGVEYGLSGSSGSSSWKDLIFSQLGLNINTPDMPGYLSVIKVMTSNNYNGQTAVGSGNSAHARLSNFFHPFNKISENFWSPQDDTPGNQCYLEVTGVDKSLYPEIGVIQFDVGNWNQNNLKLKIQGFTGSEWLDLTEEIPFSSTTGGRIDFTIDQSYKDVGIEYYKLVFPTSDRLNIPGKSMFNLYNWNMFKSINS